MALGRTHPPLSPPSLSPLQRYDLIKKPWSIVIKLCADAIFRQLSLHRMHHLRQDLDPHPIRPHPWAKRSIVLSTAGASTDGRGDGLVSMHFRAVDHSLYSAGQVLESNIARRMLEHHGLLLRHADPKHPDRLVHYTLSDLRSLSSIPQPRPQYSAGSNVDDRCYSHNVCSGIPVSNAWVFGEVTT